MTCGSSTVCRAGEEIKISVLCKVPWDILRTSSTQNPKDKTCISLKAISKLLGSKNSHQGDHCLTHGDPPPQCFGAHPQRAEGRQEENQPQDKRLQSWWYFCWERKPLEMNWYIKFLHLFHSGTKQPLKQVFLKRTSFLCAEKKRSYF